MGASPLDLGKSSAPGARESVPKAPGQSPTSSDPKIAAMPGKDGSPLSSGREPVGDPTNKSGATPPSAKIALAPKVDSNEHWGDLPIQVREVFRTEGGADLPPQYRDWIDGYYKKLLLLK